MYVKLNSLFDNEMKIYYVTGVLNQGVLTTYWILVTQTRIYCKSI